MGHTNTAFKKPRGKNTDATIKSMRAVEKLKTMPVESVEAVNFFSCWCLGIRNTRTMLQLSRMRRVTVKPTGTEVERDEGEQQEEGKGRISSCRVSSTICVQHNICLGSNLETKGRPAQDVPL